MKRRPLCIFCVLFLTVQAIRVLFFGAGDYTSALGQIVNRNNKGEINLILTGTADRIDEKESVTAVRVKGNAVSFYSGSDRKIARQSVFGKSDGHRSSYDFSQELPRKIWEEKVLVYLEKEDAAHIKIGNEKQKRNDPRGENHRRNDCSGHNRKNERTRCLCLLSGMSGESNEKQRTFPFSEGRNSIRGL